MKDHRLVAQKLTIAEFITRLMAGEQFTTMFDTNYFYDDTQINPFRKGTQEMVEADWYMVPKLYQWTKIVWEDNVSQDTPVLCWISDCDKDEQRVAQMVNAYDPSREFQYSTHGVAYRFATPVDPSICLVIEQEQIVE